VQIAAEWRRLMFEGFNPVISASREIPSVPWSFFFEF
jgi:hypothetical protein